VARYDVTDMSTTGRQAELQTTIDQVKRELQTLGDLRPGTLSEQYNVCGKAGCACKADPARRHGPYYQVSFTWQGRSRTQFVRRANVAVLRQQLRNYERLRELMGTWIAAGLELSALRLGVSTAPAAARARPNRATKRGKSRRS
jgi:hypothetical protein